MTHVYPAQRIILMSNLLTDEVKQCLNLRDGLNIVVTIGNSLRADDGVGPYIASYLSNHTRLVVLDAGNTPENFVDEIISLSPTYIVFIDAADFGGFPGQARQIKKDEISGFTLSTHMFPLRAIWEIIEQSISAEIRLIGIQILDYSFSNRLTNEVRQIADEIIMALNNSGGADYR